MSQDKHDDRPRSQTQSAQLGSLPHKPGPAHQAVLDVRPLHQLLDAVLHGDPQPVEGGPAPQVVVAAVPEAHKRERHRGGEEGPQQAMLGPARGDVHVPGERGDREEHWPNTTRSRASFSCCMLLFTMGRPFPTSRRPQSIPWMLRHTRRWQTRKPLVAPVVKNLPANAGRRKRHRFDSWAREIPWRRAWQPTPAFFPGESAWTEEPGGLQSIGHHSSDLAHTERF